MAMLVKTRVYIASQQAPSRPAASQQSVQKRWSSTASDGTLGASQAADILIFGPSGDALHCRSVKMIRGMCIEKFLMSLGYQISNAFMQNLSIWAYEIDILHFTNLRRRSL